MDSCGDPVTKSFDPNLIVPPSLTCTPANIFNIVDLPAPFSPSSA